MKPKSQSDEYGFASAARVSLNIFEMSSRQTGRTLRLIERVCDGDQVIVSTEREKVRMTRMLRDAGKKGVHVHAVPPGDNPLSRVGTAPFGRAFFDHDWVRRHFMIALDRASEELDTWQQAMSKTWPNAPVLSEGQLADRMNYWDKSIPQRTEQPDFRSKADWT